MVINLNILPSSAYNKSSNLPPCYALNPSTYLKFPVTIIRHSFLTWTWRGQPWSRESCMRGWPTSVLQPAAGSSGLGVLITSGRSSALNHPQGLHDALLVKIRLFVHLMNFTIGSLCSPQTPLLPHPLSLYSLVQPLVVP